MASPQKKKTDATPRSHILVYFSLIYTLLLMMPVLVFISSISGTATMLRRRYEESAQSMTATAARQAEAALALIERYQQQTLPNLEGFNRTLLSIAEGRSFDALDLRALSSAMPSLSDPSGVIRGCMLYHWRGDFMIEPGLAYQQIDMLYPAYFSYANMDSLRWRQEMRSADYRLTFPAAPCRLNGVDVSSCILLSYNYSAGGKRPIGRAVFFLDAQRLTDLFRGLLEGGSSRVLLFDQQGMLLTSNGEAPLPADLDLPLRLSPGESTCSHGRELATCYCSEHGWKYAVITPRSLFMRQTLTALLPMIGILSSALILSIALGVAFLRRQSAPLGHIVRLLPDSSRRQPESLSEIEQAIRRLKEDSARMESQLSVQKIQMRDACLNRLLGGTLPSAPSFREQLERAGIHLEGDCFRAAYMFLSGKPRADELLSLSAVSGCLERCADQVQLFAPVAPRQYVLVLTCDGQTGGEENVRALLSGLHSAMLSQLGVAAAFYVGLPVCGAERIHESLESARREMYVGSTEEQYLFFARETESARYEYTDAQEAQLAQLVNGGRSEEVHRLMAHIYDQNFNRRRIDPFQAKLLRGRLCSTLFLCAEGSGTRPPDALTAPDDRSELSQYFDEAERFMLALCRQALERRESESSLTTDRIVAYIGEQYGRSDMGLAHLSMQFGLTESYLSRILHERLGQTFVSYLEKKRIEHAMTLLRNGYPGSIEALSAQVGYTTVRTFQRAFARYAGCSPSAFRAKCTQAQE